jgi:hypothetical protein
MLREKSQRDQARCSRSSLILNNPALPACCRHWGGHSSCYATGVTLILVLRTLGRARSKLHDLMLVINR